jgi:CRISPR-associated protein Cas1
MRVEGVPDLIPARMLNEFTFCRRLFFLEWVDRLWAPNADTEEGDYHHRRVDSGGGAAPLPAEGDLKSARSLELSSESLGIAAKLDLVEAGEPGTVIPVDTKKGRPARDGSAWEADAIQVCAQALLLREHGYTVHHGELFYAETRQRSRVDITDDLIARTLRTVTEARALAAVPAPPPPLQSSPKCSRCSLAGICLPDEINALAGREVAAKPRRLLTADPDAHPLYITEQGATVGIDGGRLTVTKYREELASVRLIDVLHLSVFGNVQITAQAMRTLFDMGISVFHFTYGGWLSGVSSGLLAKNVNLRIRQSAAALRRDLSAPRRMIAGKIRNGRVFLRRNSSDSSPRTVSQLASLAAQADQVTDPATLLGIEGTAARLYFGAFPSMLRDANGLPGPPFTGLRNRRPPTDAVNCLLSFAYALLTKELLSATLIVGFDPYLGLLHRPRYGRPALALDLAEEFRPLLADSVVVTVLNNREISASDFVVRAGAVALTPDGRRTVLRAWERRMTTVVRHPVFDYQVTYRRAIELQARILAANLIGELPAYEPLVTR